MMTGAPKKPEIVTRDISELSSWEDNPRTVEKKDFARLKDQIERLGFYKPLLINQNNIILGGNMRYQAFKELGIKEILCARVLTDNNAQMMEYALSDNDQIGITDAQAVAEFVAKNPDIKTELFAINSAPMKLVSSVLEQFAPDENGNKPDSNAYSIKIAFNDLETLEQCLVEIQAVCENYKIRGLSVNDGHED